MPVLSYRQYLDILEQNSSKGFKFKKSFLTFAALVLVVLSGITSLVYYEYKKEAPLRAQNDYLQKTQKSYMAVSQSLDEVFENFQVAGAKVRLVDSLKESSSSADGFFVSLDDLQKSLLLLESVGGNLEEQKSAFLNPPPANYQSLNDTMVNYVNKSQNLLATIYQQQEFAREILIASGPNFYLPVLSDESLWKKRNPDDLKAYYEKTKTEADTTLQALSKLSVPQKYKAFYDTQVSYLALLVNTSDKIITALLERESTDQQTVTPIEKAYQILNSAKTQNEDLSEKLLRERNKFFTKEENLNQLTQVSLEQQNIQNEISLAQQKASPTKMDKIPALSPILKLFPQ